MPDIHEERGCLLFALHSAKTAPSPPTENWAIEEDLEAHGAGSPVAALYAAVTPLIATPAAVTRMKPLSVGTAAQGVL